MIEHLKQEFVAGFRDGWELFWSPFTGRWQAFRKYWICHKARWTE